MATDEGRDAARAGGEVLVRAMPTDAWAWAREQAMALFEVAVPAQVERYGAWLDESAQDLREAGPGELAQWQSEQAGVWGRRLARLLSEAPGAEEALRDLAQRIRAALPAEQQAARSQFNVAKGKATLYAVMDGTLNHYSGTAPAPAPTAAESASDEER